MSNPTIRSKMMVGRADSATGYILLLAPRADIHFDVGIQRNLSVALNHIVAELTAEADQVVRRVERMDFERGLAIR